MRQAPWISKMGLCVLAFVFAWGGFNLYVGEQIPINDGMGYDGKIYADTVIHFDRLFKEPAPDKRVQRFAPSGVVYLVLKVMNLPLDTENVVRVFKFLNWFLLMVCVWLCDKILSGLKLGDGVRVTVFAAFFLNFATVRMPYYDPVLTDMPAFFLGMLLVYFFLRERLWGIFAVALLGAFTWPTTLYYAFLLACFKKGRQKVSAISGMVPLGAALLATIVFFILIRYSIHSFHGDFLTGIQDPGGGHLRLQPSDAYLSLFLCLLLFFLAVLGILADERFFRIRMVLKEFKIASFAVMTGLLAGVFIVTRHLNPPAFSAPTQPDYILLALKVAFSRGVTLPLLFVLSHLVYFGPAVYLLIFYWKIFCGVLREQSLGLVFCVLFSLITLFPNSESRHLTDLFPFYVVFLALALERSGWGMREAGWFTFISFLFSKAWLPLNASGDLSLFFMNLGPWMPREYYRLQGMAAIVTGGCLFLFLKFKKDRRGVLEASR